MKHTYAQNSIFLMEIILNILLFSVLLVVGLHSFMRTHELTAKSTQLHQAVTSCENAASIFENGSGTLGDLLDNYRFCADLDSRVLIFLDENFNECRKADALYYITASLSEDNTPSLSKLTLVCYTDEDTPLYTLEACHYQQLRTRIQHYQRLEVLP